MWIFVGCFYVVKCVWSMFWNRLSSVWPMICARVCSVWSIVGTIVWPDICTRSVRSGWCSGQICLFWPTVWPVFWLPSERSGQSPPVLNKKSVWPFFRDSSPSTWTQVLSWFADVIWGLLIQVKGIINKYKRTFIPKSFQLFPHFIFWNQNQENL